MAIDQKYGMVTTDRGDVAVDEPVVVFRAKDKLLVPLLGLYRTLCENAGSPQIHLDLIDKRIPEIQAWQDENETHTPNSNGFEDVLSG